MESVSPPPHAHPINSNTELPVSLLAQLEPINWDRSAQGAALLIPITAVKSASFRAQLDSELLTPALDLVPQELPTEEAYALDHHYPHHYFKFITNRPNTKITVDKKHHLKKLIPCFPQSPQMKIPLHILPPNPD